MKRSVLLIAVSMFASAVAFSASTPATGEISMAEAQSIALKKTNGNVKSSEYEFEAGQNVYSFDILGTDGKIHEILIAAKSGKVVSQTIESASKEAFEAKADKQEQLEKKKK